MNLFAVAIIGCDFARHCIAVTKIVAGIIGNFDMHFSGLRNSINKSQWPVMSIAVDIHCFTPPLFLVVSRSNIPDATQHPRDRVRENVIENFERTRTRSTSNESEPTSATKQMERFHLLVHFTPYFASTSSIKPL